MEDLTTLDISEIQGEIVLTMKAGIIFTSVSHGCREIRSMKNTKEFRQDDVK